MARARRARRLGRALPARAFGRAEEARRAGASAGARAQAPLDGRAVLGARCDHPRAALARSAALHRGAAHERAAGDARSRRGARLLRCRLPALARPQGPHRRPISGADPAPARRDQGAHASPIRPAPGTHLAESATRGGRQDRGERGGAMGRILDRPLTRQLIAFAILVAFWEYAARAGWVNPLYVPAPSKIGAALVTLFASGSIWPHLGATFAAALGGLALGLAVGVILGAAAAMLPIIAELLQPLMILLNAVPRVVLAPLFVIWLGIGIAAKVALSFILVAVLVFFTVFTGIRQVDRRLVERVVTLGGGRATLLREVYMPSVMAWVLGNLKEI